MAYLQRLALCLLLALGGFSYAWASFPATSSAPSGACTSAPCYTYTISEVGTHSSGAAVCDAYSAYFVGINGSSWQVLPTYDGDSSCYYLKSSQYSYGFKAITKVSTAPVDPGYTCPAHSLLSGASCTCDSGYTENGGQCVNNTQQARCSAAKGGSDWFSGFSSLPTVGAAFCPSDGGAAQCGASVTGGYCTVKSGVRSCSYEVKYDGSSCTPPANSNTSAPDPCKGSSGTVNGKTVCIPLGSDPSVTVEQKTTSATSSTSGGSSTGGTSTEKATSCTGSTCTTTTTTTATPAGGGAATTSTNTKTEPKEDFCASNPQATICKQAAFGGSCTAAFTCDGDAVMCAIAKDQHTRNCALFDNPTGESALYDSEKNKAGSQVENENKSVGPSSFDTSDALGGGSCIADKQVTVMGRAISIPFSGVCAHLAVLGNVLLAVSFLLAGRIVVRG